MKVPVSTTQSCNTVTGKLLSSTNTIPNTTLSTPNPNSNSINRNNIGLGYNEPTSVLDLQNSPSPVAKPAQPPLSDAENHHKVDLDNLEGWDSLLSELGLNDDNFNPNNINPKLLLAQISPSCDTHSLSQVLQDFASSQPFDYNPPPTNLPSDYSTTFTDFSYTQPHSEPFDLGYHHHQTNSNNVTPFGLDFIDELIRGAQAFESNDSHQFQVVLSRLNQRLRSPVGKPLQRAAFYFKEALQHLANTNPSSGPVQHPNRPDKISSYDVVQTIRATKAFSGISPVSLFSSFAANQAILEAVDGACFIHIVDFDIGFGGHWASFMRELVDKTDSNKFTSIILRITAIVPEEFGIESKLVRENLVQFARELNLNFHTDFVLIPTFEILSFNSVKFIDGEKIAVHLSPSVFHRFSNSRNGISKFVGDLRGISPSSVVVVDREVGIDVRTASFGVSFIAGIEFYAGLMESLDMAAAGGFIIGDDCVRRIETFVLLPRIMSLVEAAARAAGRRTTTWREEFAAAGMKAVGFSQFADFQAEFLLRRAHVGGFNVAKRHGEMMLLWNDRPLVATSAWKS